MNTGKLVRLNRIFAHNSGRLCSVAVDHFTIYYSGLPDGLRDVPATLKAVVKGRPDAVTMHIGMAKNAWAPYAGDVPMILQSSMLRFDDTSRAQSATPEDAVRLGADAFAIACFVRGPTEWEYMQKVAEAVRQAERFDIPVICHIYPRTFKDGKVEVSFTPEDIAWAARCASELGVDVIKVPYCGDVRAYAQIVEAAPVRLVAAGGPKAPDLRGSLAMMADVVKSGAAGATIGRNIWGFANVTANIKAFKAVIHDGMSPEDALRKAGLSASPRDPDQGSSELTTRFRFPHPDNADEDGFLAVGGDLKPGTLLLAYGNGIFPWTTRPITWWSPDPRAIIPLGGLHVSRNLRKVLRKGAFSTSFRPGVPRRHGGMRRAPPGAEGNLDQLRLYRRLHAPARSRARPFRGDLAR